MTPTSSVFSEYMELYRLLPVMDGEQIWKLRRIATGVQDLSSFTDEEMAVLETKLELYDLSYPSQKPQA